MAAVPNTYAAGYTGSIKVDGSAVPVQGWSAKDSVGKWDASTSADAGWTLMERAQRTVEFSFTVPMAATALPAFSVGNIYTGEFSHNGTLKYAGNVLIDEMSPKVDIKGGVTIDCKATNHGALTLS